MDYDLWTRNNDSSDCQIYYMYTFRRFSFCLSGMHFEHLTLTGCCIVEQVNCCAQIEGVLETHQNVTQELNIQAYCVNVWIYRL